jgi:hypothetical protein
MISLGSFLVWWLRLSGMILGQIGDISPVIASEAKQSRSQEKELDCFVASAPRNDGVSFDD